MTELISTKEVDYLEEDPPIKNQNYCLLSFITPEEILKNKESYYIKYFLKKFSNDIESLFNGLISKYPDDIDFINNIKKDHGYLFNINELDEQYKFSKNINSTDVESEYHKDNNFQTTISGIKVRGVFDTLDQAKNRSEFLKKKDKNHNIFIGQVGCWCPYAPNPEDLEDQEYSETQLNTLMKEYKKNQENRDEVFEKRKETAIIKNTILEENNENIENNENNENLDNDINKLENNINKIFTDQDAWSQKNINND